MAARGVDIFGVASGVGGRDPGAAGAADAVHAAGLAEHLRAHGVDATWAGRFEPLHAALDSPAAAVARVSPGIARAVCESITLGRRPLVIGGDHSCAIGTWSGAHAAVREQGTLGLLWIDAHLDSHTPQTTHTGLIYGMPLAALLGHGDPAFTDCSHPGPKLKPEHVCVLGARSYEPGERTLLDRVGVRVIGMDEVRRLGQQAAFEQALAIVRRASAGYGMTVDLDALDPRDAPGVGTPAAGGLRAGLLIESLTRVRSCEKLVALEIAELNPGRDRARRTLNYVLAVASATLGAADADRRRAANALMPRSAHHPSRVSAR